MNIEELVNICSRSGRRPQVISCGKAAVIAALGMEGRLFYAYNGEVVSLFRRESAENISTSKTGYLNPGGDGLWPAPEGTRFGYEYSTGSWRVPAAIVSAQYDVVSQSADSLEIAAEIDLVNNQQLGIPCRFIRKVQVKELDNAAVIEQYDAIEYMGCCELAAGTFSIAPWSLSQFTVDKKTIARFGDPGTPVRDLYQPSKELLSSDGKIVTMKHDDKNRIQLALPEKSSFVELLVPDKNLQITRTSAPLAENLHPVDIADFPPDADPGDPVRYSIYNDPSGFMELETVGGCTDDLVPGIVLGVNMTNVIKAIN
ncbi:MAG: hypothetical protein E7050_11480 [Lentisphaerae bacterium]|nr:hypothetical protein [Lentisphaerota bacterium]